MGITDRELMNGNGMAGSKMCRAWAAIAVLAFTPLLEAADMAFRLAHVFQDQMVLQRGVPVPIWGWAEPGTDVTVTVAGQRHETVTGEDGYWRVDLKPLTVSSEGLTLTASAGDQHLEFDDILVGEVWLCAGQSNMDWLLSKVLQHYPQLAKRLGTTDLPRMRFIRYRQYASTEPLKDMEPGVHGSAAWKPVTAETARVSMALPFFFGRELHQELDVPVGLIQVAEGGTSQTAWSPRAVIDQVVAETGSELTYEYLIEKAEKMLEKYNAPVTNWEEYVEVDRAWRAGAEGRRRVALAKWFPCVLFNAQIHPLAPFAFRGIIWHQGEGGPNQEHEQRMVALVNNWRELFERDFLFVWGGLSRHTDFPPPTTPITSLSYRARRNFQFLRAQKMFGYGGKSAFCDFYDLGNFNTHFGQKDKAGDRFARAALARAHGKDVMFTGPQLIESGLSPGEIRLTFAHAGGGLMYRPSFDGITGFILKNGDTSTWIEPANVGHDTLTFTDKGITAESELYYGFHYNPHETLFNKAGFPASLFQVPEAPEPRVSGGYPSRWHGPQHVGLVEFVKEPPKNVKMSVTHARRHVYIFGIEQRLYDKKRLSDAYRMQLYVPSEWDDIRVEHKGKPIEVSETKTHSGGQRTIDLDAVINAGAYLVYDPSHKTEAMAEAELSRF